MKAFIRSFRYAFNGIYVALRDQRNIKVQVLSACIVIGGGLYFDITPTEWCVIVLTIGSVISLELLNCALEDLVNLVTREHHPLAGRVKDIAAGAVLISSIMAIVIGVFVFKKYFILLL